MLDSTTSTGLWRPTYALIDLEALAHNFKALSTLLPAGVEIMAMVKADAYGHGAVPVSKKLVECGAASLGVATVEEGLELREAGVEAEILVMGGLMGLGSPASRVMVEAGLTPVIHSAEVVDSLEAAAAKAKRKIAVHIKVDTGMSRLGMRPEALGPVIERLKGCRWLEVEGVMTHLASAGDPEYTSMQAEAFRSCRGPLEEGLGEIPIWHIANSTAILKGGPVGMEGAGRCWARPGLALYGTACGVPLPKGIRLKPVMTVKSRIALAKGIPAGVKVSYNGIFTAKRRTRLAVVPIGYADGYSWRLSGRAQALVGGRRIPVVGRVTMDMIMLDITDANASVGDEVVLMGRQGDQEITAEELAAQAGTISYEIMCGISKRMPRIYT